MIVVLTLTEMLDDTSILVVALGYIAGACLGTSMMANESIPAIVPSTQCLPGGASK